MALVSVNAPAVVLAEDTMVIDLRVRQHGFDGRAAQVQLLENGTPLPISHPRGAVTLEKTEADQRIQIRYRPMREGTYRWVVRVKPLPGEYDQENNSRTIDVIVRREKLRILYVEGAPRWEYRKLKDFLTRAEEAFETQCLLTSAQPGFPQESSPTLPPLTRFPDTEEELFKYDVIIFGDVGPEDISEDRRRTQATLELVRRFVENGGGFAMIAGDLYAPRAYKDTPIEDLIPVEISTDALAPRSSGEGFRPRLTELGRIDPIMQLEEDPKANLELWNDPRRLPNMYWFSPVKKARPGARVLAVHDSERGPLGPYPLLVAGNYGDGPTYFSAVDETWRWYKLQGPIYFHRYWGNVVRTLARVRLFAGDKRFRLLANRSEYAVGDQITLTAYVKDRSFRPETAPVQPVVLRRPSTAGGEEERIMLALREPGVYEKIFLAQETGDYEAWIPGTTGLSDEKISPIGFRVVVSDVERREPILDEAMLRSIAEQTGGRYLLLPEARALLQEISSGTVEVPRQRQFISIRDEANEWLWALPLVFVSLLTMEWFLRKRFRLL